MKLPITRLSGPFDYFLVACDTTGTPTSWTPQESQVERGEHQHDSNIHNQPFQESVSEENKVYTDYDGYHRHHLKHNSYLSAHFIP